MTMSLSLTTTHSIYLWHTPPPMSGMFHPYIAHLSLLLPCPSRSELPYEIEQYGEMEREGKSKEDESLSEKLLVLRIQMKNLQVARGSKILDFEDLCIHPDVDMPTGYKPPKFDIFDRTGDPHAHLRAYYDKLVAVGRNEKLRMKLFIRSLTGEALTWYLGRTP